MEIKVGKSLIFHHKFKKVHKNLDVSVAWNTLGLLLLPHGWFRQHVSELKARTRAPHRMSYPLPTKTLRLNFIDI